jgi:glutamate-1-semialdehyde 2,1-aminomutase
LIPILAANAFLSEIEAPEFWRDLEAMEDLFYTGLRDVFSSVGMPVLVQAVGARFSLLFGLESPPRNYRDILAADRDIETRFYRAALERGVYFHFSFHHGFSVMHTRTDLEDALDRIEDAARSLSSRPVTPSAREP